MLAFIQTNLSTILVGAVVVLILFFVIRHLAKNKRDMSCSCGDCGSCASSGVCSIHEQEEKDKAAAAEIHIKKKK